MILATKIYNSTLGSSFCLDELEANWLKRQLIISNDIYCFFLFLQASGKQWIRYLDSQVQPAPIKKLVQTVELMNLTPKASTEQYSLYSRSGKKRPHSDPHEKPPSVPLNVRF